MPRGRKKAQQPQKKQKQNIKATLVDSKVSTNSRKFANYLLVIWKGHSLELYYSNRNLVTVSPWRFSRSIKKENNNKIPSLFANKKDFNYFCQFACPGQRRDGFFSSNKSLKLNMKSYNYWLHLSKYRWYFLFRTIRVEYFFVVSLIMPSKEETVGTHATNSGIASLRSRWMGPEHSKTDV